MPTRPFFRFSGALILCAFAASTQAMADVEVGVLGGSRSSKWKYELSDGKHEKTSQGMEMGLSIHFKLSPKLPMSFGVSAFQTSYDLKDILDEEMDDQSGVDPDDGTVTLFSNGKSDLTGLTYGPEVMAWIPLKSFRPFLRVGYGLGTYNLTKKFDVSMDGNSMNGTLVYTYGVAGVNYGLGFIFDVNKNFGLLLEYNLSSLKLKAKKAKIISKAGGIEQTVEMPAEEFTDNEKKDKIDSGAARIGLTFSF